MGAIPEAALVRSWGGVAVAVPFDHEFPRPTSSIGFARAPLRTCAHPHPSECRPAAPRLRRFGGFASWLVPLFVVFLLTPRLLHLLGPERFGISDGRAGNPAIASQMDLGLASSAVRRLAADLQIRAGSMAPRTLVHLSRGISSHWHWCSAPLVGFGSGWLADTLGFSALLGAEAARDLIRWCALWGAISLATALPALVARAAQSFAWLTAVTDTYDARPLDRRLYCSSVPIVRFMKSSLWESWSASYRAINDFCCTGAPSAGSGTVVFATARSQRRDAASQVECSPHRLRAQIAFPGRSDSHFIVWLTRDCRCLCTLRQSGQQAPCSRRRNHLFRVSTRFRTARRRRERRVGRSAACTGSRCCSS